MSERLFEKKEAPDKSPAYLTEEDFAKQQAIDQTALLADLSHQWEEARNQITHLENSNRTLAERMMRGEAARDAMKDLLMEMWKGK
jgi:hypothetical protein